MVKPKIEPMIEPSPIRLSDTETRILMRVMAAGKPIQGDYHYAALAELGILARVAVVKEPEEHSRKVRECWKRARIALRGKNGGELHQAMHDLERLDTDRDRETETYLYGLSELGKQIARGISVRMNGVRK